MWLVNALAALMPYMQAQKDAGGNLFDSQAMREYIIAWLTVNALKE